MRLLRRLRAVLGFNELVVVCQLRDKESPHIRFVIGHENKRTLGAPFEHRRIDGVQWVRVRGGGREQLGAAIKIRQPLFGLVAGLGADGRFRRGRFRRRPERQRDGEYRALAGLAFDGDGAIHHLGQFFHQREADADALELPFRRTIRLPEPIKNVRQIFFFDTDARVAHDDAELVGNFLGAEPDAPARGRELQRVEQQVQHHLL